MEKWFIYCKKADFELISRQFNISPLLARIIRNRDIVGENQIFEYLNPDVNYMHDPFLLKDMDRAVKLITEGIEDGKKIRIVGDYDIDGVCSSYILKKYLCFIGASVDVRLPDRVREGYGLNAIMSDEAAKDEIGIVITCDNGISAVDAVKRLKDIGIKVIITDHHEVPDEIPDAEAVIDAKQPECSYPFKELCGGAVAYKLVSALNITLEKSFSDVKKQAATKLLHELLMFAGIATIGDIVPLIGENRIIASEGIRQMRKTDNIGLLTLMKEKDINCHEVSSNHIGFIIGPCINSAGRLKNAEIALNLFETDDPETAKTLSKELSELNDTRKTLTVEQFAEAESLIQKKYGEEKNLPPIFVVFLENAHESIAGIIAGRLKDKYTRPVIVLTNSEEGIKGSGRSIDAYNLIENLKQHDQLFSKFGGHAKACGFSLKEETSPEKLSEILNNSCTLTENDLINKIWIDTQLPFRFISEEFVDELKILEPYGMKNEKPCFAEKNITISSFSILGKNQNLLKIKMIDNSGFVMEGIFFGNSEKVKDEYMKIKQKIDSLDNNFAILYYPSINEYRGNKTPQAVIASIM